MSKKPDPARILETLLDTVCPIEEFRAALPLATPEQLRTASVQLLADADRGDEDSEIRHKEILDYILKTGANKTPITGKQADSIRAKIKAGKTAKPAAELAIVEGEITDAQKGEQLVAQYAKVKQATFDIVIFGAMLMQIRDELTKRAKSIGSGPGRYEKDSGFKGYLNKYAIGPDGKPVISEMTAYKYIKLAEGIRAEFRLPAKTDLVKLLSAPAAELPKGEKSTREKIEKFVEGKTQRQLEFSFGTTDSKNKGGKKEKKKPDPTPEEALEQKRLDAVASYEHIVTLMDTFFTNNDHTLLDKDQRTLFAATLGKAKTMTEEVK